MRLLEQVFVQNGYNKGEIDRALFGEGRVKQEKKEETHIGVGGRFSPFVVVSGHLRRMLEGAKIKTMFHPPVKVD